MIDSALRQLDALGSISDREERAERLGRWVERVTQRLRESVAQLEAERFVQALKDLFLRQPLGAWSNSVAPDDIRQRAHGQPEEQKRQAKPPVWPTMAEVLEGRGWLTEEKGNPALSVVQAIQIVGMPKPGVVPLHNVAISVVRETLAPRGSRIWYPPSDQARPPI